MWRWYHVQGRDVISRAEAKWVDTVAKLTGEELNASAAIALLTPDTGDVDAARARVQQFAARLGTETILGTTP